MESFVKQLLLTQTANQVFANLVGSGMDSLEALILMNNTMKVQTVTNTTYDDLTIDRSKNYNISCEQVEMIASAFWGDGSILEAHLSELLFSGASLKDWFVRAGSLTTDEINHMQNNLYISW